MEAPIITLTTDWGYKDFFAGMVKGRLFSSIPNVRITDITHGIEPFNLSAAAFIVKNGCLGFPKGTIHIIDVNTVETVDHPFIVVEHNEQYFICTDNGLPFSVFEGNFTQAIELNVPQDSDNYTFCAYHLFCKVAALIANGTPLEQLGRPKRSLCPNTPVNFIPMGNRIIAYVTHIDTYGNAYLNISYQEFERLRNGRPFVLNAQSHYSEQLSTFSDSYEPAKDNMKHTEGLLLTVSATGLLEIAIHLESAEQLLSLSVLKKIEICFLDKPAQ